MSDRKPRIARIKERKTEERSPPPIGEYEIVDSWPPLSPASQIVKRWPIRGSDGNRGRGLYVVIAIIVLALIWLGVILATPGLLPIHPYVVTYTVTTTPTTIAIHLNLTLPKATVTTSVTSTTTITKTMTPQVNRQVADALASLLNRAYQDNIDLVRDMLLRYLNNVPFEFGRFNGTLYENFGLKIDYDFYALIMDLRSAYLNDGELDEYEKHVICERANHVLGINQDECKEVL